MQYIVVGHPCQDKHTGGFRWGGGVVYSGIMVAQLGAQVTVVTRCHTHPTLSVPLRWQIQPDPHTTTFENRYDPHSGQRQQVMHQRAGDIVLDPLTTLETAPDIVHLAPVANEINATTLPELPATTWLVATPQGWMRRRNSDGIVQPIRWDHARQLLPRFHALVLSNEDAQGNIALIQHYADTVPYVLYTMGVQGALLFYEGQQVHIPAVSAQVADPTGAGDVIAAAFFVRLHETGDPLEAAQFGTVAAALSIEAVGTTGIPTRQQIAARRAR